MNQTRRRSKINVELTDGLNELYDFLFGSLVAKSTDEHEAPLYPAAWLHQVLCLLKGVA